MSPFVLSVLKYALLALLFFFVYRAVKSTASDVAGTRDRAAPSKRKEPKPTRSSRGRTPGTVVVHAPDGGKAGTFRLSGALDIGRADACAIRLEDEYVSQHHARIYAKDGAWWVEDLGSTNGTYMNERRVASPAEVHAGDTVRVGKTVLELRR